MPGPLSSAEVLVPRTTTALRPIGGTRMRATGVPSLARRARRCGLQYDDLAFMLVDQADGSIGRFDRRIGRFDRRIGGVHRRLGGSRRYIGRRALAARRPEGAEHP